MNAWGASGALGTRRARGSRGTRPPITRRASAGALAGLAFLAYTILSLAWLHSVWGDPTVRQIGLAGDPQVFASYLAWWPWAVGHGHNPVISHYLMAPGGANLLANTSVPLAALALWPVTAAFGNVASYNAAVTLAVPLAAVSAFVVCRRFTPSVPACAVAGLTYGFSPYMQSKAMTHLNLAIVVFPPFALLLLHELLVTQRHSPYRVGALLGVGAAAQILLSTELLAMTVILAGVFTVVVLAFGRDRWRGQAPHAARGMATAGVVSLALGGAFLWIAVLGPRHVAGLVQPRDTFVTDLAGLFLPTRFQAVSTSGLAAHVDRLSGRGGELSTYLGIPLVVLLAVAFWRGRHRRTMQVAGIMFVAALLLSFGDRLHVNGDALAVPMPWAALSHAPVLENILPSRYIVFAWLAAAVMLALFVEDVVGAGRVTRVVAVAALAVAGVSVWPVLHPPSSPVTAPRFFVTADVRQIPDGATAIVAPTHASSIVPMVWQVKAGFRFALPQGPAFTPEGWGYPNVPLFIVINVLEGDLPRTLFPIPEVCRQIPASYSDGCLALTRADVKARNVRAVVLGPAPQEASLERFFTLLVGAPPQRTGGVDLWLVDPTAL
ncbi:MAG: hypothetical protein JO265_00725 [Acidimicrobiia bacterium]|nr:hypothetical protein [Acidimicrobiia bacterium]